ncbi:OPT family oligopeptide transporter [Listeria fleischmannii]|jgi:putative OPT family oligopeptide transporter|uniref:Oligopeptide transporter, OPT family n=1 Tax=Listeria fleischmannii TaxID=1069827 RepID=A0A841YAH6_9LIST|nr:oligopeptide transporter, OPT family [Listeria fleischmannii]EIA19468.1 oligopeptide transporter, OPT family protein [Listeria fleischmannii subsp. coloradonensis]MBC1397273.1 oligopeptide transporter, OPT family [Listeria fleischmannii]MBC1419818.1 oligopeptide transporter, OPT family [Listeria fleischmannii]MBC1425642.1 oligopeptide transporter, OPT family [Listeria fleischmannii]STY35426.1 oligopeptide transporter, OPT family [Listeria fleischmannii subsp. coloradonensis]
MSEQKGHKPFVPYIPASKSLPELTVTSIVLGIILAVLFGAANAYLGLKVGLTVSASIPAAVISMGILRGIFKRDSILENNIVQTMTTAGEALGAGAVFTIPALFLMGVEIKQIMLIFIVLTGGFLGVFMMVPLRRMLIVNEHETLPYPEGTACAEVLKTGETGGSQAKLVALGFLAGGTVKILTDGFKLFKSEIQVGVYKFQNAFVGTQIYPALVGVGFIIGPRIAGQMVAGGLMASLVLVPAIAFFGGESSQIIFPASEALKNLDAAGIWDNYIRYIGAGAVAAGGLITLVKTLPAIIQTLRSTMQSMSKNKGNKMLELERTDKDIPMKWVLICIAVILVIIAFDPFTNVGIIGAIAIGIFGFLFVTVASRIVGIVGSSSSPVSGMTIATLLIVALVYKAFGYHGDQGIILTLTVAAIVCSALAVAGDISQDLKTGYLVGGTPWKQQVAMMIGVLASGLVMGYILTLLDNAYGMGSAELPAPKAMLMKILAEGILNGNLPWTLIFIGVSIAIVIEFLGMNSLVFAVGLYLPLNISATVMFGGFVRMIVNAVIKRKKESSEEGKGATRIERGTLFASGLIAGESLLGVIIAFIISINANIIPTDVLIQNQWLPFIVFIIVCALLYISTVPRSKKVK